MFPMCWGLVKQPLYLKKDKMKISEIKLNKKNPRLIKDYKFEKLKKSITEFPKMLELRPMIVDDQNVVLGGNMRLTALKDLGYKEISDNWVKRASELTEDEKQRFIIADNVGFGDWDWDILANEWDTDLLVDWGLDVPSFEVDLDNEIDIISDFNESSNFSIICDNLEELEKLKSKLKTNTNKIEYLKFIEILKI
jgi:hypothetical protein